MASLLEQGIQNFENENFQKAIKLFEKILKSDPDNSEAIINKTSCLAYPYHEFTKNVAGDFELESLPSINNLENKFPFYLMEKKL